MTATTISPRELAGLAEGGRKIDLIDVTDPTGKYQPPGPEELAAFRDFLQVVKAPIARRYSGGKDIGAACGTLDASQRGGTLLQL